MLSISTSITVCVRRRES